MYVLPDLDLVGFPLKPYIGHNVPKKDGIPPAKAAKV